MGFAKCELWRIWSHRKRIQSTISGVKIRTINLFWFEESILVPDTTLLSPGGDGGVGPGLVIAQLHCGEQILLSQGHVHLQMIMTSLLSKLLLSFTHLIFQRLVEDAGVRKCRRLGPFSRPNSLSHLLPPTSTRIRGIFISLHVFIN